MPMLKNLDPIAAARFGRLLDGREAAPEGEEWPVDEREPLAVRRSPAEVCLGPGQGMAALWLDPEARGGGEVFYLDRPVALRRDTAFALFPLEGRCTVRVAAAGPVETCGRLAPAASVLLRPTIRVERIFTVFCQEKELGFFFPGERHRPYELIYVDHGKLHNVIGGRDRVLTQNEALIIPPDRWHMQYGDEKEGVGFITISFTCAEPLPEEILLRPLGRDPALQAAARSLAAEAERELPYRDDLLIGMLQWILALCARLAAAGGGGGITPPATRRSEDRILDQALRTVAESTHEKLTVGELARRCSVSAAHLSKLFRRHLNTSPGAYILRAKLEESRVLIRSGEGNLSQIARLLRFSSLQHFSAAFRRCYGVAPSVYARGVRR